jgi:hypothetical protein
MAFLRIMPVFKQPVCLFAGQPEKTTRSLAAILPGEKWKRIFCLTKTLSRSVRSRGEFPAFTKNKKGTKRISLCLQVVSFEFNSSRCPRSQRAFD